MSHRRDAIAVRVAEVLGDELEEFVRWCGENWTIDNPEEADLTADQAEGWNRCAGSIGAALKLWLEETDFD